MNLTDQAVKLFTQEELDELSQLVGIQKGLGRLDKRLQVDLIRFKCELHKPEDTELLLRFKKALKIGVNEEEFELDSFEIPPCYGFFGECDCLLHEQCGEKLVDSLPDCYGILYDDIECQDCLVKQACQTKGKVMDFQGQEVFLFRPVNFFTNLLMGIAYFRSLYYRDPDRIKVHPFNRAFNIRRITRLFKHERWLPIDSFLMSGTKGQKPIQRKPIILSIERIPIREKDR